QSAAAVMKIETELARSAMDRTLRRDPASRDHAMTIAELEKIAPSFGFERYFAAVGAPRFAKLNVGNPDFFTRVNALIDSIPLESWKTYLAWQLLNGSATALSDDIVQEDFKFQQALTGQQQLQARWKRCVNATDAALGEALGQRYVEKTFGEDGKRRMLKMVDALEKALKEDIGGLPWMTDTTKKQAQIKLTAIRNKIGFPDRWRDYGKLEIERGDMLGNVQRAAIFEGNRVLQKIGKPVDNTEWAITPPTVNAYYSGERNEIVFPAGILQPPAFDVNATDAVNYGAIGVVIGHEISHGFDDQGAQFDAQGRLSNWWTDADLKSFQQRGQCVVDQFEGYFIEPAIHHNGRLVLGEAIGDLAGARIAYAAYQKALQKRPQPSRDGFTPEQQFFIAWGQFRGDQIRPETQRLMVQGDPHPIAKYRVIGPLSNLTSFQQAFSCKAGDPMVRGQNRCEVW
ncbi:MAG TPA: M13 family metallopeptidase, partial [Myxococcales bacterium]|nr:M13 family metallopeptidase [Myxococcales bacterium]